MKHMQEFLKKCCTDREMIREAKSARSEDGNPITPSLYFANLAKTYDILPTEEQLNRHVRLWEQHLKVRPWEERRREKVREFAARNWVIEQAMKAAGIQVRGPEAPMVDAIIGNSGTKVASFMHSTAQTVFPFYYESQVQAGVMAVPLIDELVMDMAQVNGKNATHPELSEAEWERTMKEAAEGTAGNTVTIKFRERNIQLKLFQATGMITRDAARSQRIPVFARGLQRVGQQFGITRTDFAMSVLIDGDGTSPTNAASSTAAATASSPVYNDVLALQFAFSMGYEPNMLIGNATTLPKILNMAEFKDTRAGFDYQATGNLVNPIGMNLRRWDVTGNVSTWTSSNVLMLDTSNALQGYTWGGMETDSDRLFDTGWDRVFMREWIGFGIWDASARRLGTSW